MEDFRIYETTDIPPALLLTTFVHLAVLCVPMPRVSWGSILPKVQIGSKTQVSSELSVPL